MPGGFLNEPETKRACPLDSFAIIRSRNPEEVRQALLRFYGARRFDLASGRQLIARANHWQSKSVGVSYCSYGAQVQLEFPGANCFRQQISLHGSAGADQNS